MRDEVTKAEYGVQNVLETKIPWLRWTMQLEKRRPKRRTMFYLGVKEVAP